MENYCISVDWLQIFGICKIFNYSDPIEMDGFKMEIAPAAQGTKLWCEVYNITYRRRDIATFCRVPRTPQMDKNACTLKLSNRVLYSQKYIPLLYKLMKRLNIEYKGITRLDLCYDCNYLRNHQSVPEFLMQFFTHQPYCQGHIIRTGSRKVIINANRCNTGSTTISGLRWGSPASDIGSYCYNKSLELLEVKDKPWIRQVWQDNGLVNVWSKEQFDDLSEREKKRIVGGGETDKFISCPVWRFEISIKAHGKDLLNLQTGELFQLSPHYLENQKTIEKLFYTYARKVFDFRMSTGQTLIKNYPPLEIFEQREETTAKPININLYADTGRTEKMIINKLQELREKYSDVTDVQMKGLQVAIDFVRDLAGVKKAITQKKREQNELQSFKQFLTKQALDDYYLALVEYNRQQRKEIHPDLTFDFMQGLIAECNLENQRESAYEYTQSKYSPVW